MAQRLTNKTHEKTVQKLANKSLNITQRLLSSVGKPLYLIITYFLIVLLISPKLAIKYVRLLEKFVDKNINSFRKAFKTNKLLPDIKTKVKKPRSAKAQQVKKDQFTAFLRPITLWFLKQDQKISKTISKTGKTKKLTFSFKLPKYKLKAAKIKKKRLRFRYLYFFLYGFLLTATILIFGIWKIIIKDLPSPTDLSKRNIEVSTKIYDRNGILLYTIYKDKNRTIVPLDEIPLHVQLATIAIEDAEFYSHPGFSIKGITRAFIKNVREGEIAGGSTITQQLVKNTLLTPEKTLTRKLKELVLAVRVELEYDKDGILEMYLNEVSYGGTAYGIQEASRVYFGKDVKKLTLAEAALLAGLPKSPSNYSPFGPNPEISYERQKEVLKLMKINGFITEEQRRSAENVEIKFADDITDIKAPHFVAYVRQILENKYGKEVLETGGLEVYTTLDYPTQTLAQQVVTEEVEKLNKLNVKNGAALVINPQTGEVLAMVGSIDYFDTENDGNVNVTLRLRQPGSSIKLINYSYALSNGYTPATIIKDSPVKFVIEGQPPYIPKNYDGKFRGSLPLRNAFAESRNVPAVRVLASYGVDKMIKMGTEMGITTWTNPQNYGLSLTLGGGEVKLIDLAQAYSTVANYGNKVNINPIIKVANYQGKILEDNGCVQPSSAVTSKIAKLLRNEVEAKANDKNECKEEKILDERVAYLLIDILKDNAARSPAFGRNSLLVIPNHSEIAVKTGTSNDLKDNLAIGFNQDNLVAVWVGNNDNTPMSRIASGITGATPIFHNIMAALLNEKENHNWEVPSGLIRIPICTLTGTLSCEGCPTRFEWFLEENIPEKSCRPEQIKSIIEQKELFEKQGEITNEAASDEN